MPLPRVRMDFITNSLANHFTQEDLRRLGLELRPGMRCVFYDFDAEGDETGYLHTEAEVWWDGDRISSGWTSGPTASASRRART